MTGRKLFLLHSLAKNRKKYLSSKAMRLFWLSIGIIIVLPVRRLPMLFIFTS